jgi:hypothetical protein
LGHLARGLLLTRGELGVGEHVARAERLGALQRHPTHVRARPFALEIRIAPRRSRSPVGIGRFLTVSCEDESRDAQNAECRNADSLHGFL